MSKMTDQEEKQIATAFRTFTKWVINVGRAIKTLDDNAANLADGNAVDLVRDIRDLQSSEEE